MNRIWLIIAGCGAIVAGVFLLMGKYEAAFVAGTLGVLSWFVDVRGQLNKDKANVETSSMAETDGPGRQDED